MELKTGWKTTEFWTTAVAPLVGAFLGMFGLIDYEPQAQSVVTFMAAVGPAAYALSRGLAKRS
ncbi:MAG: hypothetical protein QQN63_01235 [Nitrosopumilus sp.]